MKELKERCLQCNELGWEIDMFELVNPVEDSESDRESEFYCSQTCLLERLQGKLRDNNKEGMK